LVSAVCGISLWGGLRHVSSFYHTIFLSVR
jgi:hypothetical protein